MFYISRAMGYHQSQGYVVSNMINFSLEHGRDSRILRIDANGTDLTKIHQVNAISRKICHHTLSLEEAHRELKRIEKNNIPYKFSTAIFFAAVISFCFLFLQGGTWADVITAVVAGTIGFIVTESIKKHFLILFIPDFLGAAAVGIITYLGHKLTPGTDIMPVLIAGIMPIVPGVLITTAIQDLLGSHMIMFTAKALQALVISFAIGSGIAIPLFLN